MAAALFACSSDDSTTAPPTLDAGGDASMTDASHDGATADAPATDATPDTGTDAVADSGHDAGDAGDAADAADTSVPLAPLDLCPTLDNLSQADFAAVDADGGAGAASDRLDTWANHIAQNIPNPSFTTDWGSDCRFSQMYQDNFVVPDGGAGALSTYLDTVVSFSLAFLGCPGTPGDKAVFADLIPAGSASHVFTQADVTAFADLYANAVVEIASYEWGLTYLTNGTPPTPAPLTSDQVEAIRTHIFALAAAMPGVNPNTTRLTYSTCSDAGAADASHD